MSTSIKKNGISWKMTIQSIGAFQKRAGKELEANGRFLVRFKWPAEAGMLQLTSDSQGGKGLHAVTG